MSHTTLADEGGKRAGGQPVTAQRRPFGTEDWWAVAIGLFVIVIAYGLFASGGSIKSLAVAPGRWNDFGVLLRNESLSAGNGGPEPGAIEKRCSCDEKADDEEPSGKNHVSERRRLLLDEA